MTTEAAFAILDLAFASGAVAPGARAIIFDADVAPVLARWRAPICIQPWRPAYDRLVAAGLPTQPVPEEGHRGFSVALVRLGRNRAVNRATMARGVRCLAGGGTLVVAGENRFGPATHAREIGATNAIVKHKARVFWLAAEACRVAAPLDAWGEAAALQQCDGHPYWTAPGCFAWNRIDPGSALLAQHLAGEVQGRVAELGTGWGYLAIEMLRSEADLTALDLYEADWHALEAARANLDGARVEVGFHWHDVTRGLLRGGYDCVVANPPFHDARDASPELGRSFIRVAAEALVDGGRLLVVANRTLPYESIMTERFRRVTKVTEGAGYKIMCATR